MAKRTSIYLSPPIDELFQAHLRRDGEGLRSASALLGVAVDRYLEVVRRNLPEWTIPQWQFAADALRGCWVDQMTSAAVQIVQAELADAAALEGCADKWGVDWPAFEAELATLTHAQAFAVLEVVERFWADEKSSSPEAHLQSVRTRQPPAEA